MGLFSRKPACEHEWIEVDCFHFPATWTLTTGWVGGDFVSLICPKCEATKTMHAHEWNAIETWRKAHAQP